MCMRWQECQWVRVPARPAARFLQPVLAKVISTLRAPKSSEGYRRIGGGSPLRRITEEQAAALAEALQQRGLRARVYVGMRYWSPFIDEAVEQVRRLGTQPGVCWGLGFRGTARRACAPACATVGCLQRGCGAGAVPGARQGGHLAEASRALAGSPGRAAKQVRRPCQRPRPRRGGERGLAAGDA